MNKLKTINSKKFDSIIQDQMISFKEDFLNIQDWGCYNGRQYAHILPEKQKFNNIIDGGYKEEIIHLCLQIQLHKDFANLKSSQALALNLFGPLVVCKNLLPIQRLLGVESSKWISAEFEKEGEDKSEFDFFVESTEKIYFEVKYTEPSIHTKSKATQDEERWKCFYCDRMAEILVDFDEKDSKELFFKEYQLWRNITMAVEGYSVFVFSKYRDNLTKEIQNARDLLRTVYADKVQILYFEDLCQYIVGQEEFANMHKHYSMFIDKYEPKLFKQ